MTNNIKILLLNFFLLSSFIFAGSVSPVLGLRFNDILGSDDLQNPTNTLGLKMEIEEGIYSGFDVSDGDFRIFIERSNMVFGMGNNNQNQPQFTVGGYYNAFGNLMVTLDYVVNRLTDDGNGTDTPFEDQLRIGLAVQF